MFPTLIRRTAQKARPSSPVHVQQIRELYPPKKVWPPDFKKLSAQEQLKFEKKYKRRLALAAARPKWDKFFKLFQLFSVTSVFVYTILFMDWKTEPQPFANVRRSFWEFLGYDSEPSSTKPIEKIRPHALPQVK
ncbi:hypothetical protein VM1G_03613 [Cytospora mali]|uniref:Uncharacterized protein n=1 Tax=Cytospora mali TaxID=578113 RepID=A0A194VTM2_CYTMA|nr:hypothetical protein VM1G_03613 [Valsa mali]